MRIQQGANTTKKFEVIQGYTIKYHANGKTRWSKGIMKDGKPSGYWEWYRPDGTLKRSGYFHEGNPVGEWITYDTKGEYTKLLTRRVTITPRSIKTTARFRQLTSP